VTGVPDALPKYLSKTLREISGSGIDEVKQYLQENTGTAKSFTDLSEKALLNSSQRYFALVGKKAIDSVNKQRRTVVDLPDIEKTAASLNSAAKAAAFFAVAGILGSIGAAALVTIVLSPPSASWWIPWILWSSGAACAAAVILGILGFRLNIRV
jgi:hypothetical protein